MDEIANLKALLHREKSKAGVLRARLAAAELAQETAWEEAERAGDEARRSAFTEALDAIQAVRHAAACDLTPGQGALIEARCNSLYDAWVAVNRLASAGEARSAATTGAAEGEHAAPPF